MEDPMIGTDVDGYRIRRVLGRGGMGVVYEAEDVALSRTVALKMIDVRLARDEAFLRRFRSEARALARIDSPHIVSVHALRQTEFGLFIVMEYVDGGTVADLTERGAVAWPQALPIIRQMLLALEHAHGVGVIHRDIKPRNVMLTRGGRVKITDFGLAKIYEDSRTATVTQGVAGTLFYMSPEQVRGDPNLDPRSDLYSLGVTVYEMLAGRLPLDRDASEFSIMRAIAEGDVLPLAPYAPDLPERLSDVVMKALRKDPAARYASARAMRADLEPLSAGGNAEKTLVPRPAEPRPTLPLLVGRRTVWMGLAGVLVVALLALGAYLALRPDDKVTLSVETDPAGATVYVNGTAIGTTPIEKHALDGQRSALEVRAEKDGYLAFDSTLSLEAGTPVRLGTLRLRPAGVRISVRTEPAGADVYVDERFIGPAPVNEHALGEARGPVEVRAEKDGYSSADTTVDLAPGTDVALRWHLEKKTQPAARARLTLRVEPSGSATVRGETHAAGGTFSLAPGSHTVTFRHPAYGTHQETIMLAAGQARQLTCFFEQTVNVNVTKADGAATWASVWVNGENAGTTPFSRAFGPGDYRINVRREGYEVLDEPARFSITPSFEGRVRRYTFRIKENY